MELILASTSPFRRTQLQRLGVNFSVESPEVNEKSYKDRVTSPKELAKILALAKAEAVLNKNPGKDVCVIGGDQVLSFQDEILGKPYTEEVAMAQLQKLQSRKHQLITSIALLTPEQKFEHTSIAHMKMRKLSQEEISCYIKRDQPLNTCGSYKLEEAGITLFEKIETEDYTSIIGMPLIYITSTLKELGFKIPQ